MAFLDGGDEGFLADGLNILLRAFYEAPFLRLAVLLGQVGYDICLTFENAVFFAEVEEASGLTGDNADILSAKLSPCSVAASLFHGLSKLGV